MLRESKKLLEDARAACVEVASLAQAKEEDEFLEDRLLQLAVERLFINIGEALIRLRRDDAELAEQLPMLREAIAFRNIVVHGYDVVDSRIVWDIVKTKLPPLLSVLNTLLQSDEQS